MKTKIVLLSTVLFGFIYFLTGCEDAIDQIGTGIQPEGDKIVVVPDSFDVKGTTVKMDSIYAKSIYGLLGNFYDPDYGELKAGYLCQFYPPSNAFCAADSFISVDSVALKILYTTYFGDSLAPMEVTVYPVIKKPLEQNYYSDLRSDMQGKWEEYCDKDSVWGKKAYTARNLNVSDSVNLANMATNYKVVSVPLPLWRGEQFYEEYKNGDFKDQETLAKVFNGVYVASTFGSGCLLNVEKTNIYIYYSRKAVVEDTTSVTGLKDTIVTQVAKLDVTKEVIQLNSYTGNNTDNKLWQGDNPGKMYVKTPAGIFPQITIPLSEIKQKVGDKKFSKARLSIDAYPKADREYTFNFPGMNTQNALAQSRSKLLLIEPDSVKSFFESRTEADGKTTFYTTFNSSTSAYTFENIANVLQNAMDNNLQELKLLLMPVEVGYHTESSYYSSYERDDATFNYLSPSAVTLKNDNLKIRIIVANMKQ